MPNGILDYENYLNTLQTLTEIGNMFPSEQKTFRYNIEGGGTQGWTATVSYKTLIVDRVKFDRDDRPNFSDSTVIGYYTGTNFNEYSTGTISLPANMYTGGILPASLVNIPITVVNVQWNKEGTTYANNIGFIQNWEPGVTPADPTLTEGFVPIFGATSSTLTLTGMSIINYGGTLVLQARSSISDVDFGFTSRVYFYWANTGTNVLLGIANINRQTGIATLNVNTLAAGLTGGTYPMFAVFNGIRQYRRVVSNTINQLITPLIRLFVNTHTYSPAKDFYEVGDILTYNLNVVPDPAYPPTGGVVANTVTSYSSYAGISGLNFPGAWSTQSQFSNGNLTVVQRPIDSYFIPFVSWRAYENNGNYTATITNSVISNNVFTYTQRRRYRYNIKTHVAIDYNTGYWFWDGTVNPPDFSSKSINGPAYIIQNTVTNSITGTNFNMVLTKPSAGNPYYDELFNMDLGGVPEYHAYPITVIATGTVHGIPTTLTLATLNSSGDIDYYPAWMPNEQRQYQSNFTKSRGFTTSLTTGTWQIQARIEADLGTNVNPRRNVNTSFSNVYNLTVRASNTLTHYLTFQRTTSSDIIRLVGLHPQPLQNFVSFFEGSNLITTSSWATTSTFSLTNQIVVSDVERQVTMSRFTSTTADQLIDYPYRMLASYKNGDTIKLETPKLINSGRETVYNLDYQAYQWNNTYSDLGYNVIAFNQTIPAYQNRQVILPYNGKNYVIYLLEYIGQYENQYCYTFYPDLQIKPTTRLKIVNFRRDDFVRNGFPGPEITGITIFSNSGDAGRTWYRYGPGIPNYSGDLIDPLTGRTYRQLGGFIVRKWIDVNTLCRFFYGNNLTAGIGWYAATSNSNPDLGPNDPNFVANSVYYGQAGRYPAQVMQSSSTYEMSVAKIFHRLDWNNENVNDRVYSEEVERHKAFYNNYVNNSLITITSATQSITTQTVFNNVNIIELTLPLNTISSVIDLHAVWPGTTSLGGQYGRFSGFDTYVTAPPSETYVLTATTVRPTFIIPTTGDAALQIVPNDVIHSTNPVNLSARVKIDPLYNTNVEGIVSFYDYDSDALIGSANVINNTATIQVTAADFPSVAPGTAKNVNVRAIFVSNTGQTSISEVKSNIQVIKHDIPLYPLSSGNFHFDFNGVQRQVGKYSGNRFKFLNTSSLYVVNNAYSTQTDRVAVIADADILWPFPIWQGSVDSISNKSLYGCRFGKLNIYSFGVSCFELIIWARVVGGPYNGARQRIQYNQLGLPPLSFAGGVEVNDEYGVPAFQDVIVYECDTGSPLQQNNPARRFYNSGQRFNFPPNDPPGLSSSISNLITVTDTSTSVQRALRFNDGWTQIAFDVLILGGWNSNSLASIPDGCFVGIKLSSNYDANGPTALPD